LCAGSNSITRRLMRVPTPRYGNLVGEILSRCGFRHCAMETKWGKSISLQVSTPRYRKRSGGKSHLVVCSDTALWKT